MKKAYTEALLREIEKEAPRYKKHKVDTVFIGGGTPSVLKAGCIQNIMRLLRDCFAFSEEPEITIEVNPDSGSGDKLAAYRSAGINRLSIGTQSLWEEELRILGRIHSAEDFFHTFSAARQAGFDNINVDLMAALPGQTLSSYRNTLEKTAALQPEHISAYSLIIEEGTCFYSLYGGQAKTAPKGILPLPEEEEERRMDEETQGILLEKGYDRYEISNYALPGRECRHNKAYWTRKNYVGFGLGASSMVENVRFKNTENMREYLQAAEEKTLHPSVFDRIKKEIQFLSVEEQMEEFMFLGLRLTKGVGRKEFSDCFHKEPEEVYADVLQKLQREALIESGERIRLTPYGRDISNYVMAQFLF